MYEYNQDRRSIRIEEVGFVWGFLMIGVNAYAAMTPYLSGPFFHPVWILFGVLLAFISGMFLMGGRGDQKDRS